MVWKGKVPKNLPGMRTCVKYYVQSAVLVTHTHTHTHAHAHTHTHTQAKIQGVEESEEGRSYLVHYNGWNNRYDEWIEEQRLAGKVTGDVKPSRPRFSKVKRQIALNYCLLHNHIIYLIIVSTLV